MKKFEGERMICKKAKDKMKNAEKIHNEKIKEFNMFNNDICPKCGEVGHISDDTKGDYAVRTHSSFVCDICDYNITMDDRYLKD